ncbi:hypothetical protein CQW23_32574 [Capsicum baccatum]|uniref:FF domain-containing protein n=1 Tax=Capsicum baccatum TaxID=33114 RepID=A0A2G2V4E7_CAPBA|nr:hypothetical protein CQW23_32574 [Capsicum baccatum]
MIMNVVHDNQTENGCSGPSWFGMLVTARALARVVTEIDSSKKSITVVYEFQTYYYNKVTRTSKWRMPDEVKVMLDLNPISEATTTQDALVYGDGFPLENREKDAAITEIRGATPSNEKTVELGQLVYERKTEAKSAFKTLLESANIGSDCTWDQVISIFEHDERFKAVERAKDREELFKIMWRNLRKRPVASGRKFRTA